MTYQVEDKHCIGNVLEIPAAYQTAETYYNLAASIVSTVSTASTESFDRSTLPKVFPIPG